MQLQSPSEHGIWGSLCIFLKTEDWPNLGFFKTEDLKTAYLKSEDSTYAFMCWEPHIFYDL